MSNIAFSEEAFDDYIYWQTQDKKTYWLSGSFTIHDEVSNKNALIQLFRLCKSILFFDFSAVLLLLNQ